MTPLEAALRYARLGWKVFPIEGKVPLTRHGHLDATDDHSQIRAWWAASPEAAVAVYLRASGLLAVDEDPRHGGDATLAALEAAHGPLPRDIHAETRSGGHHVLMADPSPGPGGWTRRQEDGGSVRGKLGPGLDLKCNGYVVVEPSPGYRWLSLARSAPPVPEAWLALMRKPETAPTGLPAPEVADWSGSVGRFGDADAAALRAALASVRRGGEQEGATIRAVLLVHHGFGRSAADGWPFILEWNAACGEPHDEHDLRRQVERIPEGIATGRIEPPRGDRGCLCETGDFFEPDVTDLLDELVADVPEPPTHEPGTWESDLELAAADIRSALAVAEGGSSVSPLFEPALDLIRRPHPPTVWLVRGLVVEGGTLVVSGEPKTGKSWVLTEIAIAVASGSRAFGEFDVDEPGAVAYFYAEDQAPAVAAHLRSLSVGRGMSADVAVRNLYVQPRGRFLDLTKDADLALVVASARRINRERRDAGRGPLKLLVLEPLRDLHSGEEDKSDSMGPIMRRLRCVGELLKCTVGIAHHSQKNTADASKRRGGQKMRGSSAIHGSIDSGLYLSNPDGDERTIKNRVESEVKAGRSAGFFDLTLAIEDGPDGTAVKATWKYEREGALPEGEGANHELRGEVLKYLRRYGPSTTNAVERAVVGRKIPGARKGNTSSVLEAMADAGEVRVGSHHPSTLRAAPGGGVLWWVPGHEAAGANGIHTASAEQGG